MLNERNTTFAIISRAPLSKLTAYKALRGWTLPWYSSFESDFNYDFHVTLDESVAPREYNYRTAAELDLMGGKDSFRGEQPGLSVFFRLDDDLFHAYSTYARGTESLTDLYGLLDTTPYGRQEDFEDSPQDGPRKRRTGKSCSRGERRIVGKHRSLRTEHRLEAYATMVFRTAERSLRAILGAIAVHLEFRRGGVNVA
jgi:predicted dithiol-disulfide oxidoreductase (DUF899 family)